MSIIVGADQTGSGAVYTARGLHFADRGVFRKGDEVQGLEEARSIAVPFCDSEGKPRTLADLDCAVMDAVGTAIAGGAHVLLQTMASSKLGWAAPSSACMEALAKRWPDKVRIVVDACQMRTGSARIRDYLARGYIVLATGSKFFCGPAFSGALLIPAVLCNSVMSIADVAPGLRTYSNKFDWPICWPRLRTAFTARPNIGQWLRWEAALEEMRAYHAVPLGFRALALHRFAKSIASLIAASPWLAAWEGSITDPDPLRDNEFAAPTIFSFTPMSLSGALTRAQCALMHRRLHRGSVFRASAGNDARQARLNGRPCHLGQPVSIGHDAAVLRLSSSARLVTRCWSADPVVAAARLDAETAGAAAVIEKLARAARYFPQTAPR